MKKLISELIIINLMLVISVAMTGCGGNEAVNNESVNKAEKSTKADSVLYVGNQAPLPLEKLQQDFTLRDAKNTGCVVFEDLDVTSGQEIWEEFLDKTEEGIPVNVRLAFYYTLDEESCVPEYYEQEKDNYPVLYIQDLIYDGEKYTLHSYDGGKEYFDTFNYLIKCDDTLAGETYKYAIKYILVNDNTVTWEDIFKGLISSQSGDGILHKLVYNDYIDK